MAEALAVTGDDLLLATGSKPLGWPQVKGLSQEGLIQHAPALGCNARRS